MSISVSPINCQKPQLNSHKPQKNKPSFGASIKNADVLYDYVSKQGKVGADFKNRFAKLLDKFANLIFDEGENVEISVQNGSKPSKFIVTSAKKDDAEISGTANLNCKGLFKKYSGKKVANKFYKASVAATDDINNNPKQVKIDLKKVEKNINKLDRETDAELAKDSPKIEEADEIEN